MNNQPKEIKGARICVLRYIDEIVFCANIKGIESLGQWMAWLAKSNPAETFHFHLLGFLESEESKFDGMKSSNIWFLEEPEEAQKRGEIPEGTEKVGYEVTFQVVSEKVLDELAGCQESRKIPKKYFKEDTIFE